MEQRTPEWRRARIGIPTASNFDKILTPAGTPSGQAQVYLCRLLCERLLGRSMEEDISHIKWVMHGRDYEAEAAGEFEKISNERIADVGFVTSEDGKWGCSPDRLIVGKNAALEIKCPSPWKHMDNTLYGPGKDYKPQVQGQMLVGGYDEVYFFSYFPGMPSKIWKYERDDGFILKLKDALILFSKNLDEQAKKIWDVDTDRVLKILSHLMPEVL